MAKDRRLGKGLAALLGTPLEGDDAAREPSSTTTSSAAEASTAGTAGTTRPKRAGNKPATVSKAPNSSPSNTSSKSPVKSDSGSPAANQTLDLSVYEIDNNPFQPRRKFNEEEIGALAESIREHEQLQPILVRQVGDRYQLISGERRLRATIHAGLKTIRAEVREADDRLVAELAIVENLQRKDLNAIEKALSFRRYIDQHNCKQDDLAKRLKIDRSTIANLMRLLELPEEIQSWVGSEKLTAGHARALLPLGDEDQQVRFAQLIFEDGWSVRETERQVAEQLDSEDSLLVGKGSKGKGKKRNTPQVAALEQHLRLALGTKTEIRQNAKGGGKITISFSNPDEFERLCDLICPPKPKAKAA